MEARIVEERGQFAVYLDVFLVDGRGGPLRVDQKYIETYRTRRLAEIAAHWIERTARKRLH